MATPEKFGSSSFTSKFGTAITSSGGQPQRVLQIPRNKVRLINETKQVDDAVHQTVNGELIRVQDANSTEDGPQATSSSICENSNN